jgi:HPr kinase/phosphorylase
VIAAPRSPHDVHHASAVAIDGAGVLITGPSGSGKSGLALQLIALGASLIADDRTRISSPDGWPVLHAPERLAGVIEARGVGLLRVPHVACAPLRLIVDMSADETARLPEPKHTDVHGIAIRHILRVDAPHFPASIVALAKGGWWTE